MISALLTSFLVNISFTVPVLCCAFVAPEEHRLLKNKSMDAHLLCTCSHKFFVLLTRSMGVQSTTSHCRSINIPFPYNTTSLFLIPYFTNPCSETIIWWPLILKRSRWMFFIHSITNFYVITNKHIKTQVNRRQIKGLSELFWQKSQAATLKISYHIIYIMKLLKI